VPSREVVKEPGWPNITDIPISWAIKANGMVFTSGMVGIDMDTGKLIPGGPGEEIAEAIGNLEEIFLSAGSLLADVVSCTVLFTNITRDFAEVNKIYGAFFAKDPPSRAAVQVEALAGNASVEVSCLAPQPGSGRTVVNVSGWPEMHGFPLSMAIKASGMVYASGMQGIDMKAGKLVPGGIAAETTQAMANMKAVLEAAGSGLDLVTGCEIWLRDLADFDKMNTAYLAEWPTHSKPYLPTRVAVEVGALAGQGRVEIRCTAATSDGDEVPKAVTVPGWTATSSLPFSPLVTSGNMTYVSGMQGLDVATMKLVPGGIKKETSQALNNIAAALAAVDSSIENVVNCEVTMSDLKGDFAAMNEAYASFWPHDPPSRIASQDKLAGEATVEIRCAAVFDPSYKPSGPTPSPTPSPSSGGNSWLAPVLIVLALLAVAGLGLWLMSKRRQRAREQALLYPQAAEGNANISLAARQEGGSA